MKLTLWLVASLITGALAWRKGYNPVLWALGSGLLGLLILAFLPFAHTPDLPDETKAGRKVLGNLIGGVLAGLGLLILFFR